MLLTTEPGYKMNTSAVHCRWDNQAVKERTGHHHSSHTSPFNKPNSTLRIHNLSDYSSSSSMSKRKTSTKQQNSAIWQRFRQNYIPRLPNMLARINKRKNNNNLLYWRLQLSKTAFHISTQMTKHRHLPLIPVFTSLTNDHLPEHSSLQISNLFISPRCRDLHE